MEITVKVTKILEAQSGVSQKTGNGWFKISFVGETSGQYPKTVCFVVMGDERWKSMNIEVGKSYNVSFDVESREWNGKYFTDLQAWKVVCLDSAQGGQPQPAAAPAPAPFPEAKPAAADDSDDLPF